VRYHLVQTHRTWLALKLTDPPFQVQGVSVIEVRNALSLATSTIMDAATHHEAGRGIAEGLMKGEGRLGSGRMAGEVRR
jgi:hypothetical protein